MVLPRVSYCVCCRNRLHDLKQTLPLNLQVLQPDEEIVVLDYNSDEDLTPWISAAYPHELAQGVLRFYRENTAPRWFHSHAKNICYLLGHGEVRVNVDADNWLGADYLRVIRGENWAKTVMLFPSNGGSHITGRNASTAAAFLALGGYDETFVHGYGQEDVDLAYRAMRLFPGRWRMVVVDPATAIKTSWAMRSVDQPGGLTIVESNQLHKQLSRAHLAAGQYTANPKWNWGAADLTDHRGQTRSVCWHNDLLPPRPAAVTHRRPVI